VRLRYSLIHHPALSNALALGAFFGRFGSVDMESIVFSLKKNTKNPKLPAKNVSALVPFHRVGDAFAAVVASGRADHHLNRVEVTWAGGQEPEIVKWLRDRGQLGTPRHMNNPSPPRRTSADRVGPGVGGLQGNGGDAGTFSSFPDIFVSQKTYSLLSFGNHHSNSFAN
jgi:DnaJ homolog subfamily C member 17